MTTAPSLPLRLRQWLSAHPALRDALVWVLPAVLFGAVLRLLFLHYLPFAYWGADSRSYFSFAHKLVEEGYISLDEKRRFIYPLLMVPVTLLPGATLQWLAWLQHLGGLATLVPLAYVIRKSFAAWRWWIIPATVLYAGFPVMLWYEHELLGETVFFALLIWAFAGWAAWQGEARAARAARLFWLFFVPLALFLLTKPSGRFIWPGVVAALLIAGAWRRLTRAHVIALVLLLLASLTVGSRKQGAWLLYVACFPLTQLDSPLHADYKAEIRSMVKPLRQELDTYHLQDDEPFAFLENPGKVGDRPLWQKLQKDETRRAKIYMDLAKEAILAEPLLFVRLAWQRFLWSINPGEFGMNRFQPAYVLERLERHYTRARVEQSEGRSPALIRLFGYRYAEPLPKYAQLVPRLAPPTAAWSAGLVQAWVEGYARWADFVSLPSGGAVAERAYWRARPTVLGLLLAAGLVLSLALPAYRRTLGAWALIAGAYLAGVFLFSQVNPRYLAPAWPVLLVLLLIPLDFVAAWLRRRKTAG